MKEIKTVEELKEAINEIEKILHKGLDNIKDWEIHTNYYKSVEIKFVEIKISFDETK